MANRVYLVGAGPGDPALLTLAALEVLKRADVVLYDKLVDRRTLGLIPKRSKRVYVGAQEGHSQERQDRIYRLIQKYYDEGLNVARLKSGDPFIFGRGGEEVEFFRKNHIRFQVVPGITSAVGVPSQAGVPLTHRGISSGVMVLSGHPAEGTTADWSEAARFGGTLVILMGVATMGAVCKRLIEAGKDPETPACLICRGTMKGEKTVSGRLKELTALAAAKRLPHPGVIVVGDVVKLADFWARRNGGGSPGA